jgi:hypothetical protein
VVCRSRAKAAKDEEGSSYCDHADGDKMSRLEGDKGGGPPRVIAIIDRRYRACHEKLSGRWRALLFNYEQCRSANRPSPSSNRACSS